MIFKYSFIMIIIMLSGSVLAEDYSSDRNKNDSRWFKFNYMYAVNELPGKSSHDYIELEFGGRSGIVDVYGYIDSFNVLDKKSSDKYGQEKLFMKVSPRLSLDGLLQKDLSFGPVKELYIASVLSTGGAGHVANGFSTYGGLVGLGVDIKVPVMGTMAWALYSQYDINGRDWNGYQISTGWFKPFLNFENGSFISYQGYADYNFGMKSDPSKDYSSTGADMFNGLYWHNGKFSLGYGLKLFYNIYGLQNGGIGGTTTGIGHYFSVGYTW